MEKFTYNNKTVEVPSCLDEVNSEQYRQFLILSVLMNRGTISPCLLYTSDAADEL